MGGRGPRPRPTPSTPYPPLEPLSLALTRCMLICKDSDFAAYSSDFYTGDLSAHAKEIVTASTERLRAFAADGRTCRWITLVCHGHQTPTPTPTQALTLALTLSSSATWARVARSRAAAATTAARGRSTGATPSVTSARWHACCSRPSAPATMASPGPTQRRRWRSTRSSRSCARVAPSRCSRSTANLHPKPQS